MIRRVKARFYWNPRHSGWKIARELNISRERIQYILKNELRLKPLKFQKVQGLTNWQKKVGLVRAKELLRLHDSSQLRHLVFSDEKPFQIEQFVNKQNDRVYLPKTSADNLYLRLATRTQALSMVMVWVVVTADGRTPPIFIDSGV